MAKIEDVFYCFDMPHVLKNWILEFEFLAIQNLCPSRLFCICKYPTVVMLRLYDEHTKARYQNMVNLRRSVLEFQGNVVQQVIVWAIEI